MIVLRILCTFIVCISVLIANGFQLVGFVLKPFSYRLFRRLSTHSAAAWWYLLTYSLEKLFRFKVIIHKKSSALPHHLSRKKTKSVFLISNHQSYLDPLAIIAMTQKEKSLSSLKWFVKDSLKWVPCLGWGMKFLECIFLKRNWEKDQKKIDQGFRNILSHTDSIWLTSFVEGTRKNPEKLRQSQKYARTHHQPVFQHVLLPRVKGFTTTLKALDSRIDVLYDLTIVYADQKMGILDLFFGNVGPIHVYIHEIHISDLPKTELEQAQWLVQRFSEKDRLIQNPASF